MEYYSTIWVSSDEVDEPSAYYTEWSKSERERNVSYIDASMYGIQKDGTDEFIFRTAMEKQT